MPRKPNKTGDHYNDIFPTKLRLLMDEHNVRQEDLTTVLNVKNRQSVTGYVDGSTIPTIDKVIALSNYFGVTTDYLLTETDIKSYNSDLRAISDTTGLNESSIKEIQHVMRLSSIKKSKYSYGSSYRKILNDFLTNSLFRFTNALKLALTSQATLRNMIEKSNTLDGDARLEYLKDNFDRITDAHKNVKMARLDLIEITQKLTEPEYTNLIADYDRIIDELADYDGM